MPTIEPGTGGTEAGLPDVEALTRLANQLFAALPGGGQSFPAALPGSELASTPQAPPQVLGVAPTLPGYVAPGIAAGLTGSRPQFGGVSPGTPSLDLPPLVSSVPGESELRAGLASAPDTAAPVAPGLAAPLSGLPSPAPQFGGGLPDAAAPNLPGLNADIPDEAGLLALLANLAVAPPARPATPSATPSYYFLDGNLPPIATPASPISGAAPAGAGYDVELVRRDFPILSERVNGRPLIWLDNAATTQKPQAVIDRLSTFYQHENSNIHRAAHDLAARATDAYEGAREKVRRFINAGSAEEVVFVRGTTEAINLVAQTWGRKYIGRDDEILITWLEHHANIVPWQLLAQETGARLRVAPVDDDGQVILSEYQRLLGPRTKLVSFTQVSNALGTVTPARTMVELAHRQGARVLVDGAQSVSHMRTDVQSLNADWFVLSGHKVFGPTGIGVLYGRRDALEEMPPWQGGGNMIQDVTFEKTLYQPPPNLFEAGTGNIADAVGLGAALDYLERIGLEAVSQHEHALLVHATRLLKDIPGLRLIGTAAEKAGVLSFVLEGFRSEEVGSALNKEGIAVRSGHHCAQPILRRFGVESTVRPSLALYNTFGDIDALAAAIHRIRSGSPRLG